MYASSRRSVARLASEIKPAGNQTAVTWGMTGEKNFMAKAIHLFMNMDKMIGGQFETRTGGDEIDRGDTVQAITR